VNAQDVKDYQKIWSKVTIDAETSQGGDPNYRWKPKPSEPKTYFLSGTGITVNPNFRLLPNTNTTQSELSVDVAPFSEQIIFASSNATPWPVFTLWGTGVYWSLDGGQIWGGADNSSTLPGFVSNDGDPASVIGNNGHFYEGYIHSTGGNGISVSTDNGATWTSTLVAPNPGSLADKNHLMVDKTPGSPFEGRIYAAWTDFGGPNTNDVVVRYSTDNGATWSSSVNISQSINAGSHSQGVNIQTAANGDVYAAFAIYDDFPSNTAPEDAIGFAKSTDGGVTWNTARIYGALTPNGNFNFGVRGFLNFGADDVRVASFPSMAVDRSGGLPREGGVNGNIYICWPHWSSPVIVNDVQSFNQYFPWCTVDQSTGQLMFVWYDSRLTGNDSTSVWMARSLDGGTTFDNFEVSEQPFKPKPIAGLAGGYQGDYIGIAALNDVAYPYWSDDRTGNYQGWMSVVNFSEPCPILPASNPNPASGTTDVSIDITVLTWENGPGAVSNETYFGTSPGGMSMVQSGSLATSWTVAGPLEFSTTYYWQIVEIGDTCNQSGPIWNFTTEPNPDLVTDTLFFDPFESGGLSNWIVTNDSSDCDWLIFNPTYPNAYTLPATSAGGVLSADSDECGPGTSLLSTIEFDNDFRTFDMNDDAFVEISTNGGSSWYSVWERLGVDARNSHEVIDITSSVMDQTNVKIRVRSVQPAWDWWWTIDNFAVFGMLIVPVELTSFTAFVNTDDVELTWITATETNNEGFEIQRKIGNSEFEAVGYVNGHGTTTEARSYTFIDTKLEANTYSYRLKQIDFNGSIDYSNEITVEVTPPLKFELAQNYPNPFNPSTIIKYSIPQDDIVSLDVFNLLGEKVASLVNGFQKAGRYEIKFNASYLASGIYVYKLNSGSFNSVKKMLLMK
jgi:hypothetical protein